MRPDASVAVLIGTLLAMLLIMQQDLLSGVDRWADNLSGGWLAANMRYSQWFVGDTLLAILFAVSVFAAKFAPLDFGAFVRPIKYMASCTFTLYMVHGLVFKICLKQFGFGTIATAAAAIAFTWLLAIATEHQKDRLQRLMAAAVSAVNEWSRRWLFAASRS